VVARGAERESWHQAFFSQRRLTSKLKHLILSAYMREFAYHLGSARPTVYYIDGFAGAGVYRQPDGREEPGSPVLIARLAKKILESDAGFRLRCINVEANRQRHAELQAATRAFGEDVVEANLCRPFTEAVPEILRRIGQAPAFFFIDPFGTKGIRFRDLLPVLRRRTRTEVLITLHTDGIVKKAGYFAAATEDSTNRRGRLAVRMTMVLADALDVPWDTLRAWWLEDVDSPAGGGTDAFEQRVLAHYRALLRAPRTAFQFVKAFPVHYYRPGLPPVDSDPVCFYLMFGSQHAKGLYKMNDCMVRAVDRLYSEEYGDTLFPSFREAERSTVVAKVREAIVQTSGGVPFTIDQVKRRLMEDTLLLATQGEYRKAVIGLAKRGVARQLDAGNVAGDRTRFAVGRST
jgi:three-Cys-motif partner protein